MPGGRTQRRLTFDVTSDLSNAQRRRLADLYADPAVRSVAGVCRTGGVAVWVVGGAVRDALAGTPAQDIDLLVDAAPQDLPAIVRAAGGTGKVTNPQMGVVRGRVRCGDGWTPVDLCPLQAGSAPRSARLREDLRARDLTVNALALDAITGQLTDPFAGGEAIRTQLLDSPDEPRDMLASDHVRLVRVARYHAVLGFELSDRLEDAAARLAPFADLPGQRVYPELAKVESAGRFAVQRFVEVAARTGLLTRLIPEVSADAIGWALTDALDLDSTLARLTSDLQGPIDALRRLGLPRAHARRITGQAAGRADERVVVPTLGVQGRRAS